MAGLALGFQRHLIYFPGSRLPPAPEGITAVTTTTDDGLVLTGWLARHDPDEPLLLVFQGNAGTVADRLALATALRPHGIAVLLAGYRGYGGNPGSPSEEGLALDALAWRAWADADHGGPMAYFGESLGTGVATRLALSHPPAALILRSPFTSLADVGRVHYPFLPVGLLLRDRFEVADRIARVDAPVLVVAAEEDRIVPMSLSRAVYDAATEPKRWLEIPGVGHNDRSLLDGPRMIGAVVDLLGR